MQTNIRHVHAGIDNELLICGLDCPQLIGPEPSHQVPVEMMLSIAAGMVVQVEFHSIQAVEMEMEGCSIAVFHVISFF
jgi:hypothetical protein